MKSWEWLEGLPLEEAEHVAVREFAKVLAEDLKSWPPLVEWVSTEGARPAQVPPSLACVEESLAFTQLELDRDFDGLAKYDRDRRLERRCPESTQQANARFLRRYLCEACYSLMERTENRIRRQHIRKGMPELRNRLCTALSLL